MWSPKSHLHNILAERKCYVLPSLSLIEFPLFHEEVFQNTSDPRRAWFLIFLWTSFSWRKRKLLALFIWSKWREGAHVSAALSFYLQEVKEVSKRNSSGSHSSCYTRWMSFLLLCWPPTCHPYHSASLGPSLACFFWVRAGASSY